MPALTAAQIAANKARFDAVIENAGLAEVRQSMIEVELRDSGALDSAAPWAQDHRDDFDLVAGVLTHRDTGLPAKEYIRSNLRNTWPTMWPQRHDQELAHKALVTGDVTACGLLLKQQGPEAFAALQKAYGVSKIGEKGKQPEPNAAEAAHAASRIAALKAELAELERTAPKAVAEAGRDNPWLQGSWSVTRQGALVKSLGISAASGIAKSAGCVVGSLRPNPAYNRD